MDCFVSCFTSRGDSKILGNLSASALCTGVDAKQDSLVCCVRVFLGVLSKNVCGEPWMGLQSFLDLPLKLHVAWRETVFEFASFVGVTSDFFFLDFPFRPPVRA